MDDANWRPEEHAKSKSRIRPDSLEVERASDKKAFLFTLSYLHAFVESASVIMRTKSSRWF
jgi:hypothetical protein